MTVVLEAGPETSDAELLARYRGGELEAFRAVYARHARALVLYARAMCGDAALADDLVQEAFVRLIDRHDAAISTSAQSFLYTVVRNLVLDEKRRAAVRKRTPVVLDAVADGPSVDPEAVAAALEKLPDEQRETVLLKIYTGLTFNEIARIVDVSAPTVMSRYRYALEKLATLLEGGRR